MNIIFFGTSEFAIPALRALIENDFTPVAIITAPDKPKNRGKKMSPPPIKEWVQSQNINIPTIQPTKIDAQFISQLANLKPDIGIVVAYGKILPKSLIELFPKQILNIHPSLLPKYRGPAPIQGAILNGDAETGVTIMLIDEKMDSGPILAQQTILINKESTSPTKRESSFSFLPPLLSKERGLGGEVNPVNYQELHNILADTGAKLLSEILPQWISGEIEPLPQDDTKATYTKLLKKEDGKIDLSKSAEEIDRQIRALNPWPGSYIEILNPKSKIRNILKIKNVEIIDGKNQQRTFFKTEDGYPAIICQKGALKLLVVQPEGKKEMNGKDYLLGHLQILESKPI